MCMDADEPWKNEFVALMFPYTIAGRDVIKANTIKNKHIPASLYKYRAFNDQNLQSLQANQLWMSAPKFFNDPYDTTIYYDSQRLLVENTPLIGSDSFAIIMEEARKTTAGNKPRALKHPVTLAYLIDKLLAEYDPPGITPEQKQQFAERVRQEAEINSEFNARHKSDEIRSRFSVVSLAEIDDSVLMWSHYADDHSGFCIEYHLPELDPGDIRLTSCFPIFYRKQMIDATDYVAQINPSMINDLAAMYMSLIKSSEWSYEREWRIVFDSAIDDTSKPIDMPIPKSVTVGIHVSPENETWMRNFCQTRGIEFKKIVQDHRQFILKPT